MKPASLSVALLHYPMTNRDGKIITTAVTNIDLHDIARSCRTYEVDHFFVVTPIEEQHKLIERILGHWNQGKSLEWHPDRAEALSRIVLKRSFLEVSEFLNKNYGRELEVVLPDARPLPNQVGYEELKKRWHAENEGSKVIVFGTGWGVAPEFYREVHTFLAPIYGPLGASGYNHLSVRAAAAIILDRLLGV